MCSIATHSSCASTDPRLNRSLASVGKTSLLVRYERRVSSTFRLAPCFSHSPYSPFFDAETFLCRASFCICELSFTEIPVVSCYNPGSPLLSLLGVSSKSLPSGLGFLCFFIASLNVSNQPSAAHHIFPSFLPSPVTQWRLRQALP